MSSRLKANTRDNAFAGCSALPTPGAWLPFAEQLYRKYRVALGQVAANAHDEALYLILRTLGLPLNADRHVLDRLLRGEERTMLERVFRRRLLDRVPAAYLTKEAWLGGHRFYVDERVIIPRSYLLEIIPHRLDRWLPDGGHVNRAIDVCTGSGCLAILLAHKYGQALVDACDISGEALEVAKINVREHRLGNRIRLCRSDVLEGVPPAKYDLILSNPPYEPSAVVDAQDPEFAAEPRMAHDGGRDGLRVIRKLLQQASDRLSPRGIVVIETGGLRTRIEREFAPLKPKWLRTHDGTDCVALFQASGMRGFRPREGIIS